MELPSADTSVLVLSNHPIVIPIIVAGLKRRGIATVKTLDEDDEPTFGGSSTRSTATLEKLQDAGRSAKVRLVVYADVWITPLLSVRPPMNGDINRLTPSEFRMQVLVEGITVDSGERMWRGWAESHYVLPDAERMAVQLSCRALSSALDHVAGLDDSHDALDLNDRFACRPHHS
jgi:hypothetical protein